MKPRAVFLAALLLSMAELSAQEETPTATPEQTRSRTTEESSAAATAEPTSAPDISPLPIERMPLPTPAKRGFFGRVLHPFSGGNDAPPRQFSDPKLRGLVLDLHVSPQTVK